MIPQRRLQCVAMGFLSLAAFVTSFSPSQMHQQQRWRSSPMNVANALSLDTTPFPSLAEGTKTPKVGVLLLNLGGPETSDDVEGTCVRESKIISCYNVLSLYSSLFHATLYRFRISIQFIRRSRHYSITRTTGSPARPHCLFYIQTTGTQESSGVR